MSLDNNIMYHVYSSMTIKQLVAIFKEKGIKGYSKKKKSELIDILCKKDEIIKSEKDDSKTFSVQSVTLKKKESNNPSSTSPDYKAVKPTVTLKKKESNNPGSTSPDYKPVKPTVTFKKKESNNTSSTSSGYNPSGILSCSYWKDTQAFSEMQKKESQYSYYKRMCSSDEVLQLACLESKSFGSQCEKIIQELFQLDKRTSSQNDGTRNGKGIEIKSARYWCGKDECVWQHLEPNYDYDIVLFALLDFNSFKVWAIKKSLLVGEMITKKIVTRQGKQGLWTKKSCIIPYLTPINSIADLDNFLV